MYICSADIVHISVIHLQKFFETLASRYWFVGAGSNWEINETMIGIFILISVGMNVTKTYAIVDVGLITNRLNLRCNY